MQGYDTVGKYNFMDYCARVETEMSIAWAEQNPKLFADSFAEFFVKHPAKEWTIKSTVRPGFLTLIAIRNR